MKNELTINEKTVAIKSLHLLNQFGKGNYAPIKEEILKGSYNIEAKDDALKSIDEIEKKFHDAIGDIKLHSSFAYAKLAKEIIKGEADGLGDLPLSKPEIKVLSEASSLYTNIGLGKFNYPRDQLIKHFNGNDDRSVQGGFFEIAEGFDLLTNSLNNTMGISHEELHQDYKESNEVSKKAGAKIESIEQSKVMEKLLSKLVGENTPIINTKVNSVKVKKTIHKL